MKFDLVSDIHVDHHANAIDWTAVSQSNVLVIAGDLSNSAARSANIAAGALTGYEDVIFVDGNHEFYDSRGTVQEGVNTLNNACRPHLFYLGDDPAISAVKIESTAFIGANGWYDWAYGEPFDRDQQHAAWKRFSNDSRFIRFDEYPDKMAKRQAENLAKWVRVIGDDDSVDEIVMVTHTVPLMRGLRMTGMPDWDSLNGSYGNSQMKDVLAADKARKIKVWCFGHTHYNNDFDYNGVRFISAPRGYSGEQHMLRWKQPLQVDTETGK